MVYLERKRRAAQDAAEAAGEDIWADGFDEIARTKLSGLWEHLPNRMYLESGLQTAVDRILLLEAGVRFPPTIRDVLHGDDTDLTLSYIEALGVALQEARSTFVTAGSQYEFWASGISKIFEAHRLKYKFLNGKVVPLSSEIMHAEVVEPTLVLLHGRPEFANAEKAFRDALEELTAGKPDDAITDAGTALQEALTALGCKGNKLGDLIKDAKGNGWFGPRDSPLADSIAKIYNWVAAERNAGEAHRVSEATKDAAWFVVHVVGAAIVRLAAGPRTNSETTN